MGAGLTVFASSVPVSLYSEGDKRISLVSEGHKTPCADVL